MKVSIITTVGFYRNELLEGRGQRTSEKEFPDGARPDRVLLAGDAIEQLLADPIVAASGYERKHLVVLGHRLIQKEGAMPLYIVEDTDEGRVEVSILGPADAFGHTRATYETCSECGEFLKWPVARFSYEGDEGWAHEGCTPKLHGVRVLRTFA